MGSWGRRGEGHLQAGSRGAGGHREVLAGCPERAGQTVGGWGAVWGRKEEAMGRGGMGLLGMEWEWGLGAWSHFGHSHFTSPRFGL